MKAILIVDMPSDCTECQFCGRGGRNLEKYVCCLTREHSEEPHLVGCPLRPLPRKLTEADIGWGEQRGYRGGWNNCLAEITGETE